MHRMSRSLLASLIAPCTVIGLLLPSCGGGSSGGPSAPGTGFAGIELEESLWGRLVDVFDKDGNLYVQDWNQTGRVTKLRKSSL